MVTVGMPDFSRLHWSTTSHEVQLPQSPWAAITRSGFRETMDLAIRSDSGADPEMPTVLGSFWYILINLVLGNFLPIRSQRWSSTTSPLFLPFQRGNTLGRLNLGNLDGAGGVHEIPFQRLFRVWSRGRNLGRWHAEEQSSSQCQNV